MRAAAIAGWALTAALLGSACTQVLDIQDARFDSSLSAGSGGAHAGSSASAGGKTARAQGGEDDATTAGDDAGVIEPSHGGSATGTSGGNAGGGDSSPAAGGDDGETPVKPSLCESYCDTVMTNCKGKYEQYRTFDQCVEVCKRLPPGNAGDENVNSVECRVRQAGFSAAEPFVYCKSSGPLGAGKCGSNCVSYCSLMQATCTPESTMNNVELSYFDSSQACLEACGEIPAHDDDPTQYSSSATAEPSCYVGNNVFCRAYHITAALEQDAADEHCPHAMGGDPCIDQ